MRAVTIAGLLSLLIATLFHSITPQGVFTGENYAALAAFPAFFMVSELEPRQALSLGRDFQRPANLRELLYLGALVYAVLAFVYFFADIVALPLLLTPANSTLADQSWIIGGNGTQDGNFLFPLAAFAGYPLAALLTEWLARFRNRRRSRTGYMVEAQ